MPKDSKFEDVSAPKKNSDSLFNEFKENYKRSAPIDRMPMSNETPPVGKEIGKALGISPKTKIEAVPMPIPEDFNKKVNIGGREIEFDSRPKLTGDLNLLKKGGKITAKKMASGGKVSSASKRADGCAVRGKTKGRIL